MNKKYKVICYLLSSVIVVLTLILFLYYQTTVTVIFDSKGGTIFPAVEVRPYSVLNKPNDPVLEGYKFLGWFLDGELYDFNQKVSDDIILVAKWQSVL